MGYGMMRGMQRRLQRSQRQMDRDIRRPRKRPGKKPTGAPPRNGPDAPQARRMDRSRFATPWTSLVAVATIFVAMAAILVYSFL